MNLLKVMLNILIWTMLEGVDWDYGGWGESRRNHALTLAIGWCKATEVRLQEQGSWEAALHSFFHQLLSSCTLPNVRALA